ncbi:MAG: hypothetical protein IPM29_18110 [Planctomycetes bacterium]|nr:hypothetical protein [Planctomycetota bacterium]
MARTPLVTLLTSLVLAACSGGGGGGSTAPATIDGSWELTLETTMAPQCAGRVGARATFALQLTQSGAEFALVGTQGASFRGALSGTVAELSGSWPIAGGTASVLQSDVRLTGDRLLGTVDWTWSDATSTCAGRDSFDAVRLGNLEPLTGLWDLQEEVRSATCQLSTTRFRDTWEIVQQGDRIDVLRQASRSSAAGTLGPDGSVALDFLYTDARGQPAIDQFTLRFLTGTNPPSVQGASSWQSAGCTGSSDHTGLRTGDLPLR